MCREVHHAHLKGNVHQARSCGEAGKGEISHLHVSMDDELEEDL